MTPDLFEARTRRYHMVRAAGWSTAMRWALRGAGLLSTLALARLLEPEDFGIVAMAMLAVYLVDILAQTGQRLYLVRMEGDDRALYDAAWTFSLLQAVAIALVLVLIAPWASLYFGEPRTVDVLRVLALRPILLGLENIGIITFRKELRFRRLFTYDLSASLSTIVITVGLALLLRDYWALVYGMIGGAAVRAGLSYVFHPYRPRPRLARLAEVLPFSVSIFAQNLTRYIAQRADEVIVAGISGGAAMGAYNLARQIAAAPSREVASPMSRAQFPIYARLASREIEARRAFLDTLGAVAATALPTAFALSILARDVVPVLLGAKWAASVPLLAWLAPAAGLNAVAGVTVTYLNATGGERLVLRLLLVRAGILLGLCLAAAKTSDLSLVAASRTGAAVLLLPLFLGVLARPGSGGWAPALGALWRPSAATAIMVGVVVLVFPDADAAGLALLAGKLGLAAVSFLSADFALWALAGRPNGLESGILSVLRRGFIPGA